MRHAVVLPAFAFWQVWDWEMRTRPPTALGRSNDWRSADADRRLEQETMNALAEADLLAGSRATPEFREVLATLAHGHRFSAYVGDIPGNRTGKAVVAVSGRNAVRAVHVDETIRVEEVPAETAVEHLVDLLPEMPPARLDPVAIPLSGYREARRERYEFAMDEGRRHHDPAEQPRRLMAAPRLGYHQFYGGEGKPITVVDVADEGRVLTFVTPAPTGGTEPTVNFLPGTRQYLVDALGSPGSLAVRGRTPA